MAQHTQHNREITPRQKGNKPLYAEKSSQMENENAKRRKESDEKGRATQLTQTKQITTNQTRVVIPDIPCGLRGKPEEDDGNQIPEM